MDTSTASWLSEGNLAATKTAVVAAFTSDQAEKEIKTMDPNAPGLGPEGAPPPMTPEEQAAIKKLDEAAQAEKASEASSESGSEKTEASSPPSEAPEAETEGDVNEDEVGVVEGVGADRELDAHPEVRGVSVTCHKCSHKNATSVTRKEFDDQMAVPSK